MDFADVSLVLLAERTGLCEIVTFDRKQFEVYRLRRKGQFNQLLPALTRRSVR